MANKKISEFTALTTPDDADVFPIVDTSATTTKKITWANLVTAITTFVNGLFGPVSLTVAQAQAMAGGTPSYFKPGRLYKITDAYSGVAVINIKAYSTTTLENYGFGTFQNAEMDDTIYCQMWYDLITDKIYRVFDPIKGNDVSQVDGTAIDNFPFDNAGYESSVIADCTYSAGVETGSFLVGCTIGHGATVNMSSAGNFTNQFTDCVIGAGKTADFSQLESNYTQTSKVYEGDNSTFEVTPTDAAEVNPDLDNKIDMAKFQFAGILLVGDGSNDIKSFLNYPTDHGWKIKLPSTSLDVINAGNILKNSNGVFISSLPFSLASGDEISFKVSEKTSDDILISSAIIK